MEENLVTLTIDGIEVKAEKGTTILEAASKVRNRYSNIMLFKRYK
jgi:predicted molibdopterin-dependent oxidoreductase YjgC